MPFISNQYNYATPLSDAAGITSETYNVPEGKLLTLLSNTLDGTYFPITGDVGIWGSSVSDQNGLLAEPFEITVNENLTVNAYRLVGDNESFPVDFTVRFYNGSELLYEIREISNTDPAYVHYMQKTLLVTSYTLVITRISAANSVARVYNTHNLAHVKRYDTLSAAATEYNVQSQQKYLSRFDHLAIDLYEQRSDVTNIIDVTHDTLSVASNDTGVVTNIHSVMKSPSRRVYGKVYITYVDPMLSSETEVEASGVAYNSQPSQVLDGVTAVTDRYFTLYDNDLTGSYVLSGPESHVGWVSDAISDAYGVFDTPQLLRVNFSSRPINAFVIYFDDSHGSVPKDFNVYLLQSDEARSAVIVQVRDNTAAEVNVVSDNVTADVHEIQIEILSTTLPGHPAIVVDLPVSSTFLYKGYQNESNLVSIDLLEELTYKDEVEALGGVSANEITVMLDNSSGDFYFNSKSPVSSQLKRNRKIQPYLGAEIYKDYIEWFPLGTFWSHNWTVPVNSLTATVVGFDTLGLLDTTDFINHQTLVGKSLGYGIAYVLDDARKALDFVDYRIAPELYDIIIPYMWFEQGSHTNALRKIADCYPMHIYCDREGVINAAPQKLRLDYHYDVWSDSTNVMSKTYDSLYTTLPNIINVTVVHPVLMTNVDLVSDSTEFDVSIVNNRVLNFDQPYVSGIILVVDCDPTVTYEYNVYSWGINIDFSGTGKVRSINCTGNAVDISNASVLTSRDANSIRLNGAVTRDITSDFIQTSDHASVLLNRLNSLSEFDKYDAKVDYRGDISLTINDPIRLLNGIAPDDRYNIKRHQLFWNGSLSGSADLNT